MTPAPGGGPPGPKGPRLDLMDPSIIDPAIESRAATFENPPGGRGLGGSAHGGRKGAPSRVVAAGERVILADVDGPGVLRHLWLTSLPAPPETRRAQVLEVFYDGAEQPSISVPVLDFFGLPHGRPAAFASALKAVHEGRGCNSFVPMPFGRHVRVEFANASPRPTVLYYQIAYTLTRAVPEGSGYLHVAFRRQNPTVEGEDFVIAEGLAGPGRFLGCVLGIRVLDEGIWYGEGEVKMYLDGDRARPTICGTGLEDYVGSAWGMGPHAAPYGGCTLDLRAPGATGPLTQPAFVGLYRWHVADPVIYATDLRVTVQQLGAVLSGPGQEAARAEIEAAGRLAGGGWQRLGDESLVFGIVERVDDYCAAAFTYCAAPQPVPRVDVAAATADLERRAWEQADPMEGVGAPSGD